MFTRELGRQGNLGLKEKLGSVLTWGHFFMREVTASP